jgi:periplasmic protein TonB
MKTQWVGICVSLAVHGMAALLLFNLSQGFSSESRPLVFDLSFEAAVPLGKDSPYHLPHQLSQLGIPNRDKEAIPSLPAENALDSADTEPQPVSTGPPLLHPGKAQPVKNDPPPLPRPIKQESTKPEPPSPSVASKRPEPEIRKRRPEQRREEKDLPALPEQTASPPRESEKMPASPEPASAKTFGEKKNARTARNKSHGDRLSRSATASEDFSSKLKIGPPDPGGGGLSGEFGDTHSGKTANNGENAYLSIHFGFIRRRLRQSLCYPRTARQREWAGKVLIAFTIQPNGKADRIEIRKSCGIPLLDKSALFTVRNAGPFPKPPTAVRIIIPILYQLN